MMIKLIASDLDGTLLKAGETALSAETERAVLSASSSGIDFAVISGRDALSLEGLFAFARERVYLFGCDGAVGIKDGRVIYSRPISDTSVINALKYARDGGRNAVFCAANAVYAYGKAEFKKYVCSLYGDGEVAEVKTLPDIKGPIYKISFFADAGEMKADFSDFGVRLMYNGNGWTEYVCRLAGKGAALSALQSRLGLRAANTAALGDKTPDCEMLARAEISFALGKEAENACPEARRAESFCEAYGIILKETE